MPLQIPHECVDRALAAMLDQELGKATVPIALVHEDRCDFFFYAETVNRSRHSSLRMAVPRTWLNGSAHRSQLKAAARLFRRHVRRHLHPD